ncbi:MAG: hypothetical protein OEY56_08110, partial [Cyclobacteriaceae bacterium]|nr:hypothetical protein [Cyclobacteriaceae bacterium]
MRGLLFFMMACLIIPARSQTQMLFSWEGGNNLHHNSAVYGTLGVADPANDPGGRNQSVTWTDASGNFWLFGGERNFVMNDLWKYDGSNWTWVSGSKTPSSRGAYGTRGVADPANVPGARNMSVSWIDSSGNLWLFGGNGYDDGTTGYPAYLNDLWKYDGTQWTWVSGGRIAENAGVYGVQGVAAAANVPGARASAMTWIDNAGILWLFGGYGADASGTKGYLNDLWKFDGTNWTWVNGSNAISSAGVYGTQGVADAANVPGARRGSAGWVDASGVFWLFGGIFSNPSLPVADNYNDLWKFDGTSWTWISGSNVSNQNGIYGTQGVAAPTNMPGGRTDAVCWKDNAGDFYVFGGSGLDETSLSVSGSLLNDLWKYDGINWTWVGGSKVANEYGNY